MRIHREDDKIPIPPKVPRYRENRIDRSNEDRSASKPAENRTPFYQNQSTHNQMVQSINNALVKLDLDEILENYRQIEDDWYCVHNPRIPRQFTIGLVHTITHSSAVTSVHFSSDGRFIATGSNRAAQIFDTLTGQLVSHLQDPPFPTDGDLYTYSVRFSPDGASLATGDDMGLVTVSLPMCSIASLD